MSTIVTDLPAIGLSVRPSILTSFSITGSRDDLARIPVKCGHIEVYAFMRKHLARLFPSISGNPVEIMARLYREHRAQEVASAIMADFPNRLVVGFATFMPGLTARNGDADVVSCSREALHLLIQVAKILRHENHPIQTIELVGGSRIDYVYQRPFAEGSREEDKHYVARRSAEGLALRCLLERIEPVAEEAATGGSPVYLGIELEPGPLFTISSKPAVRRFCSLLAEHPNAAVRQCVGLNLDIPHWGFLAHITPSWLEEESQDVVRRRIVHSHVSDHQIAHFCDGIPGTFNLEGDFVRWFEFLKALAKERRPEDVPKFSGFVSCEMEACKEPKFLQVAYDRVDRWLS